MNRALWKFRGTLAILIFAACSLALYGQISPPINSGDAVTVPTLAAHQAAVAKHASDVVDLKSIQDGDRAAFQKALAAIEARLTAIEVKLQTPPPVDPPPPVEPPPPVNPPPTTGALLQKANLVYAGAFRLPPAGSGENWRESSFKNAHGMSFDPANGSLFVGGHETQGRVGQVTVPEIRNTGYSGLATATVIQSPQAVISRMPTGAFNSPAWFLGSLVVGNDLIVACTEQYDSDRSAARSHGRFAGKNLGGTPSGFYQVGTLGSGIVGGYMSHVPAEWQARLGTKYLTGIAGLSISSRTSQGPAAIGFDSVQFGTSPAPTVNLLYYPYFNGTIPPVPPDYPLANTQTQNNLWNASSQVRGMAFIDGTDSVLFFGTHGTGPLWYGTPGVDGNDPAYPDKGYHAYPYAYYVWAYDAKDLEKVKAGTLKAWEVRPYAVWSFDLPLNDSTRQIGGAAWDAAGRRIFVSARMAAPDGDAIMHVFTVK